MSEDIGELDEILLVGYGNTSRDKFTGSLTKVDAKILQTTQNVSFADALIGVAPGLLVQESFTNPDTPPSILLRGVGSINADTEPLIVVDGVQMPSGFSSSAINVNDIEDISILKDAAATSIYGSRGSNGVILVTTKRGTKNTDLRVQFNTRFGIVSPDTSFMDDMMNASQKLDYEEYLGFYTANPELLEERRRLGNNINWADLLLKNEVSQNHDIALYGGGEKSNYYSSISYSKVENIYGSNYERFTASTRADFELAKNVKLELSGNFGNVENDDRRSVGNPFSNSFLLNPWETVYDENGNPLRNITYINGSGNPLNPLFVRDNTVKESVRKNIGGSANLSYNPFSWLTLRGIIGANFNTSKGSTYENLIVSGGKLDLSNSDSNNYTATVTATIDKDFDIHNFNLVLGHEVNENEFSSFSGTATGFMSDAVKALSAALNPPTIYDSMSHAGSISYFSRLNYSYDDTYNLSISYRRDGSSRFGNNNKYANFWAVGGAWNMKKSLFEDLNALSDLKLRGSIGVTGNDFIGNFASKSLYRFRYNYDGSGVPTLSRGENPNLTWEKNQTTNFGLDFGILKNKISGSIDYYVRTTKDLLNSVPIPLTSGFETLTSNIGEFRNTGIEVSLRSHNIINKDFSWTTDFNIASNKGEVISLTEDRNLILMGNIAYKAGSRINALYIVDWQGVNPETGFNQYRSEDGTLIYYNTDQFLGNRNEITELRQVIDKTSIPKFHGGITNSFNYKNFDASFLISFAGGNYILNSGLHNLYNNPHLNQHQNVLNAWANEGDFTDIAVRAVNTSNPTRPLDSDFLASTQFLQKGDYIKLKNFVVGYTLDKKLINKIGLEHFRVFVQGQNLLTFTEVDYIDPEFATGTGGVGLSSSISRGFSFGINVNF